MGGVTCRRCWCIGCSSRPRKIYPFLYQALGLILTGFTLNLNPQTREVNSVTCRRCWCTSCPSRRRRTPSARTAAAWCARRSTRASPSSSWPPRTTCASTTWPSRPSPRSCWPATASPASPCTPLVTTSLSAARCSPDPLPHLPTLTHMQYLNLLQLPRALSCPCWHLLQRGKLTLTC